MRSTVFLFSSLLLTICSCSLGNRVVGDVPSEPGGAAQPFYDYTVYFRGFDNPWVGRSRAELIEGLGPPDAIYEARHWLTDFDAGIPAVTYLYVGSVAGSGHCMDAYVIDMPTATVIKYYCR